jgi:hypothetical protein
MLYTQYRNVAAARQYYLTGGPNHALIMPHRRQYYLTGGPNHALIMPHRRQYYLTGGPNHALIMPHRRQYYHIPIMPQYCLSSEEVRWLLPDIGSLPSSTR